MKAENKEIQFFDKVGFVDILLFTKHLAMMIKSGITLSESIDTIATQTKSNKFKKVLDAIAADIRNGKSFPKALEKHEKIFKRFYISLIEIGEESGTLSQSLDYLAQQLAKEYSLKKKIQNALLYPAIVLVAITVVGIGMSIFVLPKLVDLFESLNTNLPITTKILLFFANIMKHYGLFVIGGLIILVILFRIGVKLPIFKPKWDRLILSFPIFGPLLQNEELTSLCRNLGVMLKSGLSITRALEVQYAGTENSVFKDYVNNLQKAIDKGKDLQKELSLGNYSKFSPIAIKMIGVGEKTGKLDEAFLYLGDFFEDEVDNIAKNLSVVLEPIMLLFIGLIVGFVAMAIISPIYSLTGAIK